MKPALILIIEAGIRAMRDEAAELEALLCTKANTEAAQARLDTLYERSRGLLFESGGGIPSSASRRKVRTSSQPSRRSFPTSPTRTSFTYPSTRLRSW